MEVELKQNIQMIHKNTSYPHGYLLIYSCINKCVRIAHVNCILNDRQLAQIAHKYSNNNINYHSCSANELS